MSVPFEGGCLCRAIRYRCTAEPMAVINCYCRDCQYASGGVGATAAIVSADAVEVQGSPASYDLTAESGATVSRLFCRACGSPVFARNSTGPALLAIKAGSLDDSSWLAPGAEVWTRSAPAWARLDSTLPSFGKNFGET